MWQTWRTDARWALLSLGPENFSISLWTCYNYTQNFRKVTREAKRHHEGRGINPCVSLHKAPDTASIKDLVIDVHWSSSNVNAILNEAAQNPTKVVVASYDAKQVVRRLIGTIWKLGEHANTRITFMTSPDKTQLLLWVTFFSRPRKPVTSFD